MQEMSGFAELPGISEYELYRINVYFNTGMSSAARLVEDVTQNVSHFNRNG